jgi:hypothetical protein
MKHSKADRVKYFSKHAGANSFELLKAEPILQNFDRLQKLEMNDIIELYQIKLYIDNDLFLDRWTEKDRADFKETVKVFWEEIRKFWISIDGNNFEVLFNEVEIGSQYSFWKLVEIFETYKKVPEHIFIKVLDHEYIWLHEVLQHEKLVNYYGHVLRQHLLGNVKSAEFLLDHYEKKHDREFSELHFPNCLSQTDKENIILNYLDWEDANLNYVRLIVNSKDIKISHKTRLKATKVEQVQNNEILETGHVWKSGNQVSLSKIQEEPVLISWEDNIQSVSYSSKWLDQFEDSLSLFQIFSNLFWFTDESGLIQLVSKRSEMDTMETILMTSKNTYSKGTTFNRKSNLSQLQIIIFKVYLQEKNKTIEHILSEIIEELLNGYFGLKKLKIKFPSENTSNLEKVRMIAPEFESFLKQYHFYIEEGEIDHELLQISSTPITIKEISSSLKRKYGYPTDSLQLKKLQHSFFSDQSMLWYVEPYKNKYHNLFGLLAKEDVKQNDFEDYQKPAIESFIAEGYLAVNNEGFVKVAKTLELYVLCKLYKDEVISYWHFPLSIRKIIDKMEIDGFIQFRNTLFTIPEQKYFNYYLNKSEFTNGLDLRNKYLHATNSDSDEEHQNSYLTYLKLFILALIKIVDDLALNMVFKNEESV